MASALLLLGAPQRAHANTYDVLGCNEAPAGEQNKQPFTLSNNEASATEYSNECPYNGSTQNGVYLRSKGTMCASCTATADFWSPTGTVITGVAITRIMSGLPADSDSFMRAGNYAGTTLDGCDPGEGGACNTTNDLGPSYTDIADTTRFWYQIGCVAGSNGCFEAVGTPHIKITHIRIRVDDTTNPTITTPGGSAWTSSPINGTKTVTATGSDSTGIRFSKLQIDGVDVPGSTENYSNCDFTTAAPCTAGGVGTSRSVSHTLDTTQYSDGNHTLALVVGDAAQNPTTESRTITIDNTPPAKPTITEKPSSISHTNNAYFAFTGAEPGGSFECRLDGSGSFSSCTSPKSYPNLSDGAHTFEVRQIDGPGNVGQAESYAWTIQDLPLPDAFGGCASPTANLADGYAGDTYVTVRYEDPPGAEQWVCISTANPQVSLAGKLVINTGQGAGLPSIDNNAGQCAIAPNNQVPPHPPLEATVGDGTEVPQVNIKVDAYANPDEAWACLHVSERLGADEQIFDKRVVVPLPDGGQVPTFAFKPYDVQPLPPPEPGPVGYPSSTCRQTPGGEYTRVINMDLTNENTHLWVDTRQPSDTHAQLCARVEGAAGIGGMFDVNADGSPGASAVPIVDEDTSRCGLLVLDVPALGLTVKRTAAAANPAAVCVDHTSTNTHKSVGVNVQGSPDPPTITWSPDTGTPGGQIGPLP